MEVKFLTILGKINKWGVIVQGNNATMQISE